LELVTEIAAASLGFIALFIAVSNAKGRFTGSDRHFVKAQVLASSVAIVVSLTPSTLMLFVSEQTAWKCALYVILILGSVMGILMGFEQKHVRLNKEEGESLLWHIPPWAIASCMLILGVYALYTGNKIEEVVIATATLCIPLSLWNFIALVFRRFF
jgi:hypothetical protein